MKGFKALPTGDTSPGVPLHAAVRGLLGCMVYRVSGSRGLERAESVSGSIGSTKGDGSGSKRIVGVVQGCGLKGLGRGLRLGFKACHKPCL